MNMFNNIKETLRKRRNMNATMKELASLTDAELSDIGINRCDINTVARGVIDFHRTVRDTSSSKDVE